MDTMVELTGKRSSAFHDVSRSQLYGWPVG
jgi:hypothetical protein